MLDLRERGHNHSVSYPIFPSLSRSPSYKSTRSVEDGTIKDAMESGYVATRPRFTRLRRKFGVTIEHLTAEDIRALDKFEVAVVQGQAGAFYMPNLLPNGSFEVPAVTGAGVLGWNAEPGAAWSISTISEAPADGLAAMAFSTTATPSATTALALLVSGWTPPVAVGDVYQVCANAQITSQYSSATVALSFIATVLYADETESVVTLPLLSTAGSAYQITESLTIPAAASGAAPAVTATLAFRVSLVNGANDGGSPTGAFAATVVIDAVGMALTSSLQPYGRIPGSAPTGTPVRFTKQPAIRDSGWAGGCVRYDCAFEVTEL